MRKNEARRMPSAAGGSPAELVPFMLVLLSLVGTLTLVIAMYRKPSSKLPSKPVPLVLAPVAKPSLKPLIRAHPKPVEIPAEPEIDPTRVELARIATLEADERNRAQEIDAQALALESANLAATGEAQRWKRRETLIRAQGDALSAKAQAIETEAELMAMERDVLARRRDEQKRELDQAKLRATKGGTYAVFPYKGSNGTWQHPICIECAEGSITLQPLGLTFSMLDITSGFGIRSNPLAMAVVHELTRLNDTPTPDGMPRVPYILFLVRPDGIRAYYEARGRLETMGIAFGYELVEQDWQIEYPQSASTSEPGKLAAEDVQDNPVRSTRSRPNLPSGGQGRGGEDGKSTNPDDFVWPASPSALPSLGTGGLGGSGSMPTPAGRGPAPTDLAGGRMPTSGSGGSYNGGGGSGGGLGADDEGSLPTRRRPPAQSQSGTVRPLDRVGHAPAWQRSTPNTDEQRSGPTAFGDLTGESLSAPRELSDEDLNKLIASNDSPASSMSPAGNPTSGGRRPALPPPNSAPGSTASRPAGGYPGSRSLESPGNAGSSGSPASSGNRQPTGGIPPLSSLPEFPNPSGSRQGSGGADSGGQPANAKNSLLDEFEPPTLHRPIEIVLECEGRWLRIDPGGYKLTPDRLAPGNDSLLKMLRGVVAKQSESNPGVTYSPSLRFVVDRGGESTYWSAMRQVFASGIDWPLVLNITESDEPLLPRMEQHR